VTNNAASQIDVTEFTEPFAAMTKGVASLDYQSTNEEAGHPGFGREMLLVLEVHPTNGGWDTSLTKREC
jgi:hypothetical protein